MCLNKLKLKHKKSTRTICNAGYRDHTAPLFAQLKIFPLSQLIKYSTLTFMHSFAHNMLPFSFCQMWTTTNRDHNPDHGFRNADPLFNFPKVWNNEDNAQLNPIQHRYLKYVKQICLLNQN